MLLSESGDFLKRDVQLTKPIYFSTIYHKFAKNKDFVRFERHFEAFELEVFSIGCANFKQPHVLDWKLCNTYESYSV